MLLLVLRLYFLLYEQKDCNLIIFIMSHLAAVKDFQY